MLAGGKFKFHFLELSEVFFFFFKYRYFDPWLLNLRMQKYSDTEGQLYVRIKWSVACSVLSTAPGIRHLLVTGSICHCSPQSRETWQPPSAPWVVVLGQCTERPRIHLSRIFQSYCVLASIFILSPSFAAGRLRATVRTTLSSRCATPSLILVAFQVNLKV